ncbi:exopolysaccharide biosynthesis polyprenyl glycosylphosphotransferase [Paraliomyxa miuraensis]|uniref:exopolysaccharide biosynthesis polyprenyl glycosylphosphotransferase n=1 Tax=Paraliomyxa miuraensis TaxID=376150 RepID=UPI00225AEE4D|nr:exopolysaccharide biosynthesis polyprenyl glycosylphosphotransferase [Paraliomyxa miuraensis]MCX4246342.1 exopolysaccharide biosynthesis polyprenyl glycosylphosphotransferase [Paraliomyxa miuraensis]
MSKRIGFVVLDAVVVAVAIELAAWLVRAGIHPRIELGLVQTTVVTVAGVAVAVLGAYLCALDDPAQLLDRSAVLVRSATVGVLTSVAMLLVSHTVWFLGLGRIALVLIGITVTGALAGWRLVYASFLEKGPRVPVVVLGDGPVERRFAGALSSLAHTRLRVVGLLHDDEADADRRLGLRQPAPPAPPNPDACPACGAPSLPVLGRLRDAARILPGLDVAWAIVLDTTPVSETRVAALSALQAKGVRISTAGTVWMNAARRLPLDLVDARWVLTALEQNDRPLVHRLKRCIDVGVSAVGLLLLAALWPWLWLVVRLDSPGPVLFAQDRVGHRGRSFRLYKIRTMVHQPKDAPARWAGASDVRVTRVGRVLRQLRIDELPQLYNVLRGEMSLVGPRPEQPTIVQELQRHIAFFDYRHLVKPGITGWAQIHQGYAASVEASAIKLSYDLYYVGRHSLAMDLDIILRTMFVMLARIGSR